MKPKKRGGKMKKKTIELQVLPIKELEILSHVARVQKILKLVRDGKIVLLDGRLDPVDEAELIKGTMKHVDKEFQGIELGVLTLGDKQKSLGGRVKSFLEKLILGYHRGITIIGPANIIQEIKQDPDKAILLMELKK